MLALREVLTFHNGNIKSIFKIASAALLHLHGYALYCNDLYTVVYLLFKNGFYRVSHPIKILKLAIQSKFLN